MMTNTKTRHLIGSTGVAECGQRLSHGTHEHIAESAVGLLSWAEQYSVQGVCPDCLRLAVAALVRRGHPEKIPARFEHLKNGEATR